MRARAWREDLNATHAVNVSTGGTFARSVSSWADEADSCPAARWSAPDGRTQSAARLACVKSLNDANCITRTVITVESSSVTKWQHSTGYHFQKAEATKLRFILHEHTESKQRVAARKPSAMVMWSRATQVNAEINMRGQEEWEEKSSVPGLAVEPL